MSKFIPILMSIRKHPKKLYFRFFTIFTIVIFALLNIFSIFGGKFEFYKEQNAHHKFSKNQG
jgi:hypothetical protein